MNIPENVKIMVLIADDDPDTRDLLRTALETKNYTVVEVADGHEMVEKSQVEKPNLIIADVMMPRIDGFEGVQKLRETPHFKKIPVLFISCIVAGEAIVSKMKNMPFCTFLEKPFDPKTLLRLINELLAQAEHAV
ncbi:MAG: response regulator [Elusimicrobia bacterium]|nr:response regulator [Elusimicrobiota bacterium]MBD3412230.1 response regulator [Elusimicrobiota bacterium]